MEKKLQEPRFEKYLDGGKYTVENDDDPEEKKQHVLSQAERYRLYMEDYETNSVLGYERWSKFISQKLAPTRSKFLFKKKYNVGKMPDGNELSAEDEAYLESH